MRVLVVDAYTAGDPDAEIVKHAISLLEQHGNLVEHLSLAGAEFDRFMSADERRAYETDAPLLADETKASAAAVQRADALLFCYPSVMFGVPPRLKGWLERVMVLGVAFVFDDKQRIRPGMKHVRRLGVITTSPHGRLATARARDLGRRTFMRTMRLNCHPICRRTFVRMETGLPAAAAADRLRRPLARWA